MYFQHPTLTLLLINKISKPMDILNIVKSYLFYDKKSLTFAKKVTQQKKLINCLIKEGRSDIINSSGYWIFDILSLHNKHIINTLQAYNCTKCGEFSLVMWTNYKVNNNPTLPKCTCVVNFDDY